MDAFLGKAGTPLRNIARHRAAIHSSAVDGDHTAQLVTDGIIHMDADRRVRCTAQHPAVDSPERESAENLFDGVVHTQYTTFHGAGWVQVRLPKANARRGVSQYLLTSAADAEAGDPAEWTLQGSDDGRHWKVLDIQERVRFCGRQRTRVFPLCRPAWYRYYRLDITGLRDPAAQSRDGRPILQLARFDLLDAANRTLVADDLPPDYFDSTWCADAADGVPQYVYVDLGTQSVVEAVRLFWPNENCAVQYDIQISDDAAGWRTVYAVENGTEGVAVCRLPEPVQTRFVRLFCRKSGGERYTLSEMEVYGCNALTYVPAPPLQPERNGVQRLRGGCWRVERRSEVTVRGEVIASAAYEDDDWLPAVVPGTVLASFCRAGAVPAVSAAEWAFSISARYFAADFWYRSRFALSEATAGKHVWLCFDGVFGKADIYFNGQRQGEIDGAFRRKRFDVTKCLRRGGENFLAVLVHAPTTAERVDREGRHRAEPTAAGAAESGTSAAPGLNSGFCGDVFLRATGDVCLADPLVTAEVSADHTRAALQVRAVLSNVAARPRRVTVKGVIEPSGTRFSKTLTLPARSSDAEYVLADAVLKDPRLWWPNTYGDQPLYTASLAVENARTGTVSDTATVSFGVRDLCREDGGGAVTSLKHVRSSYSRDGAPALYCNGVRIVCRGGERVMDELDPSASEEECDEWVRLYAEAGFTLIRHGADAPLPSAFYKACDQYGVFVWQEPRLGDAAEDAVRHLRRHPCAVIDDGRNDEEVPAAIRPDRQQTTTAWNSIRYSAVPSVHNPKEPDGCSGGGHPSPEAEGRNVLPFAVHIIAAAEGK